MYIAMHKRDYIARKARNDKFKEAMTNVRENFPLVTTRKEKVCIARDELSGVFDGFAKYIILKGRQLNERSKTWEEYNALVEKTKMITREEELVVALEKLGELEDKLWEAEKPLAFATHDKETQDRFILAADYADVYLPVRQIAD